MIISPADRIANVQEYYFSRNNRRLDDLRQKGVDVINLGVGSPDMPPAPEVVKALAD